MAKLDGLVSIKSYEETRVVNPGEKIILYFSNLGNLIVVKNHSQILNDSQQHIKIGFVEPIIKLRGFKHT